MPIGEHIIETGLMLSDGRRILLHRDDGGKWELGLLPQHRDFIGKRVRVQGRRSGFNLIDVSRVEQA